MATNSGSSEVFRRVRELFERAIELPAEQRRSLLDRECVKGRGDDDVVRAEVEQLLSYDDEDGEAAGLLDRGAEALVSESVGGVGAGVAVGGRIGAYRLCSVLGSGGMGTVYEAEQDEPRRRVALKVLSLGLANEQAVRRFKWEAEVLAKLRHPAIAQVHAVGVHNSGNIELPWFAMELVPGARDLIRYAAEQQLTQRQRIELLLQVCDAIHHGHLQGVVHRDLKPQNVLVDDAGRVKVIDFGIARSMAGDAEVMTEGGLVLGTLHYMSPEQLAGASADLRSDIWSLGIVAFELLAGRRPFVFEETTPFVVAETVRSQEAPRLGTVLKGVDRDLEVVVQKALRREPDQRYGSAAELAEDLRAFLEARPVGARAPSTFYQVRMFARRRRGLVTAVTAIVVLVVVALVVVLAQNAELERRGAELASQNTELQQRQRRLDTQNGELRRRELVSRRVAQFAREFLHESSLMQTRGVDYTVREALDVAAEWVESESFEEAEIEAQVRQLLGETYAGLSLPAVAEPHLQRALSLWTGLEGATGMHAVHTAMTLMLALNATGRRDEAITLLSRIAGEFDAAEAEDDVRWWDLQHQRAFLLRHQGRLRDAEARFREVLAARERLLGADHGDTIVTLAELGHLVLGLDRPAEARDLLSDALSRSRRAGHPEASTLQIADNLAEAWRDLGDLDRAADMHRTAMAGYERLVGPDHHLTIGCGYHLLKVLYRQQDLAALEELGSDLLMRCERTFGAHDYRTMDVLQAVAAAKMGRGDHAGAVRHMQRAFDVVTVERGEVHPDRFNAGNNLTQAQLGCDDVQGALRTTGLLLDALAAQPDAEAQMSPGLVGVTWLLRAQVLVRTERLDEARTAAQSAHRRLSAELSEEHPLAQQAAELVASLGSR